MAHPLRHLLPVVLSLFAACGGDDGPGMSATYDICSATFRASTISYSISGDRLVLSFSLVDSLEFTRKTSAGGALPIFGTWTTTLEDDILGARMIGTMTVSPSQVTLQNECHIDGRTGRASVRSRATVDESNLVLLDDDDDEMRFKQ